jgi:hypothetical protein
MFAFKNLIKKKIKASLEKTHQKGGRGGLLLKVAKLLLSLKDAALQN